MNKREVIKRIEKAAKRQGKTWAFSNHGGRHDIYTLDGVMIPIPRHTEIADRMAEIIWKECEEVLGKGWWRK